MSALFDGKKRWICPSDRELTLRAKLNAGWSIHTQDCLSKPEPISETELKYIESVIERAKEADFVEKERIRKMVCKLENMRRNSIGDGRKTCSMCGVYSRWFRTSFVQCSDCFMAVCEKCRIDINNLFEECVLCKICAENREMWKKSGGWFYGILPRVEKLNCDELKCFQAVSADTWEHRARDIVRLESFEAPEKENLKPFYQTWAINSSPDLNTMESDIILKKYKKNKFRKCSEGAHLYLEKQMLSKPDIHISMISASCPALQAMENDTDIATKKNKKSFSRKRFLKPARKIVEKLGKHKIFH